MRDGEKKKRTALMKLAAGLGHDASCPYKVPQQMPAGQESICGAGGVYGDGFAIGICDSQAMTTPSFLLNPIIMKLRIIYKNRKTT
jgi:hypothetical protein